MAVQKCPYCKSIIDDGAEYCANCGTKLLFDDDEYSEEIPGDKIISPPEEEKSAPAKPRASAKKSSTQKKKKPSPRKKAVNSQKKSTTRKKSSESKKEASAGAKSGSRSTRNKKAEESAPPISTPSLPDDSSREEDMPPPLKEHTRDFDPMGDINKLLKDRDISDEIEEQKDRVDLNGENLNSSVDFEKYIDINEDLSEESDGKFDPLIGDDSDLIDDEVPDLVGYGEEEDAEIAKPEEFSGLESDIDDGIDPVQPSRREEFSLAGDEELSSDPKPDSEEMDWEMDAIMNDDDGMISPPEKKKIDDSFMPNMDEDIPDEEESIDFNTADLEQMFDPADKEKEEIERFLDSLKRERQEIQGVRLPDEDDLPPWAEGMKAQIENEPPLVDEEDDQDISVSGEPPALVGFDEPPPVPAEPDEDMDLPESIGQTDLPFQFDSQEEEDLTLQDESPSFKEAEAEEERETEAEHELDEEAEPEKEEPSPPPSKPPVSSKPAFPIDGDRISRPEGKPPATLYESWKHKPEPSIFPKIKARIFDVIFIAVLWFATLWVTSQMTASPIFQIISSSVLASVGLFFILLGLYFFFFFFFLGETLGNHLFSGG